MTYEALEVDEYGCVWDEYLQGVADGKIAPEFEKAHRIHDWRNYVGSNTRAAWDTFSSVQRAAIMKDATVSASLEDWD